MSKIAKIDNIIGMAEQMEPLLSQNQFTDDCIIEIKQHPSKFVFMHLLPSNHFPLLFSFLHPTDLPQIMWVNKTFREGSRHYIKKLTSSQKKLISQEITKSTIDTMKKITADVKVYFNQEPPFMPSDDIAFDDPERLLPKLVNSSRELDVVKQLLHPVSEDRLKEQKNQKLLLYTGAGLTLCSSSGLWATLFMWVSHVAPLTLKIVASASGGILVLSSIILILSQSTNRITKGCSRQTLINFQGYNLWNEEAMRLRRAIAYLRLLDGTTFTGHSAA